MPTPNTKFSTALCYGATKSGKTREIGAMSLYIYQTYGKTTRLISADGGGWESVQDYVDAGIIEPINISDAATPLTLLHRLARGDWEVEGKWLPRDHKDQQFSNVGMYAIEGFYSICQLLMGDQIEKGRKIAEDVVGKFAEKDADTGEQFTFGNASRAHYGFVQQRLLQLIREFQGLCAVGVNQILFTSLESSGEDEFTNAKILGPASAGKALTQILPQRVGDLIHLEIVAKPAAKEGQPPTQEYRAYFQPHIDSEIRRAWPASLRLTPTLNLELQKDDELRKGYVVLTDERGATREGVSRLWRWRDRTQSKGVEELRKIMNSKTTTLTTTEKERTK